MKDKSMCSNRFLAIIVLLMACQFLQAQTNFNSKLTFSDEFIVDVNKPPYTIKRKSIAKNMKRFEKQVKCPDGYSCTSDPLPIKASDMVSQLYALTSNYINDPNSGCADRKCISGIWIFIAMENGQPAYFFQPAVFRFEAWAKKKRAVFIKDTTKLKSFWVYKDNTFTSVDTATMNRRIKEYEKNIRIKHYRYRGKPEPVNLLDDTWRGDTRKLFYSFQEILGFYALHNPVDQNNPNDFYKNTIYIHPSVGLFRKSMMYSRRVKHNTFIKVDASVKDNDSEEMKKLNEQKAAINASADGTDLAHVCPSNCDNVTYPAATTKKELEKANKR